MDTSLWSNTKDRSSGRSRSKASRFMKIDFYIFTISIFFVFIFILILISRKKDLVTDIMIIVSPKCLQCNQWKVSYLLVCSLLLLPAYRTLHKTIFSFQSFFPVSSSRPILLLPLIRILQRSSSGTIYCLLLELEYHWLAYLHVPTCNLWKLLAIHPTSKILFELDPCQKHSTLFLSDRKRSCCNSNLHEWRQNAQCYLFIFHHLRAV